ncbi:MAG: ferrous iron transport protein A [Candidatus Altiarchaeales archaeon]|nr:MAG: ferrous iron transport protein A [Candidatus Altiarchaeales archaeon]HDO82431.1 ferrous iron transport protein A [Candidatus Altiarchaeales archaeon]HEX55080.1 ferrous iron transport protein A [Candidatus Altiarchaeales archaeon]
MIRGRSDIGRGIPLTMVKDGERVRIISILGGMGLKKRLYDLGLYEGAKIDVIRNDRSGPIILKVLDSRIGIGRGQANKIIVGIC